MISYVLPTRDRPERLAETLAAIARLDHSVCGGAEVIVVDNASARRVGVAGEWLEGEEPRPSRRLDGHGHGDVRVRVVRLEVNLGAAARNIGVKEADRKSEWVVMLDDDSYPVEVGSGGASKGGVVEGEALTLPSPAKPGEGAVSFTARPASFAARLKMWPREVAAVMADIHLPRKGCREAGGLPEVFIGCGVAIRRKAFLEAGGYDAAFGYYAEEYDLAAKLMLAGQRVEFDPAWRVDHVKDDAQRDMNVILGRLVRNNGWVMQRYSPASPVESGGISIRRAELRSLRRRYRAIAEKENALTGFARGLKELRASVRGQVRRPLPVELWERFTGLAHARAAIGAEWKRARFAMAAVVEEGKNCAVVREVLRELGVREVSVEKAELVVVGTMSPGPMLDGVEKWGARGVRVLAPWMIVQVGKRAKAA